MSTVAKKLQTAFTVSGDGLGETFDSALLMGENEATTLDLTNPLGITQVDFINNESGFDNTSYNAAGFDKTNLIGICSNAVSSQIVFTDASNPSSFSVNGRYTDTSIISFPRSEIAVDSANEVCFVTSGSVPSARSGRTIQVLDYSTISSPTLGTYFDLGTAGDSNRYGTTIDETNQVLYSTTGSRIYSYDVSDLAGSGIVELDNYYNPTDIGGMRGMVVDVANEVLYGCNYTQDKLVSVDISDPANLVALDTVTDATNLNNAYTVELDTYRNLAFVYCVGGAINCIDISDPSNMVLKSTLTGYTGAAGTEQTIAIDTFKKLVYLKARFNLGNRIHVVSYTSAGALTAEGSTVLGNSNDGGILNIYNKV
jgi:hypothetical protein